MYMNNRENTFNILSSALISNHLAQYETLNESSTAPNKPNSNQERQKIPPPPPPYPPPNYKIELRLFGNKLNSDAGTIKKEPDDELIGPKSRLFWNQLEENYLAQSNSSIKPYSAVTNSNHSESAKNATQMKFENKSSNAGNFVPDANFDDYSRDQANIAGATNKLNISSNFSASQQNLTRLNHIQLGLARLNSLISADNQASKQENIDDNLSKQTQGKKNVSFNSSAELPADINRFDISDIVSAGGKRSGEERYILGQEDLLSTNNNSVSQWMGTPRVSGSPDGYGRNSWDAIMRTSVVAPTRLSDVLTTDAKRLSGFESTMGGTDSVLPTLMVRYRNTAADLKDDPAYVAGAVKILQLMHSVWLEQSMCDVILETEGGTVLAHQIALAAYSPALQLLFRTRQGSRIQQTAHMNLRDFTLRTVADIVNFVYTTTLELDCRNIGEVLACSRQLDMIVIVELCQNYLIEMATPDNIILHYSVAANNDLIDIRDRLHNVICQGFSEIYTHRHFLFLPFDRLMAIFTNENLCAEEIDIFLAIVRWVDYCRSERLPLASQLLQLVRFQNIDPERLTNEVQTVDWIFVDKASLDLVLEAFKYHALNCLNGTSGMDAQPLRCSPRRISLGARLSGGAPRSSQGGARGSGYSQGDGGFRGSQARGSQVTREDNGGYYAQESQGGWENPSPRGSYESDGVRDSQAYRESQEQRASQGYRSSQAGRSSARPSQFRESQGTRYSEVPRSSQGYRASQDARSSQAARTSQAQRSSQAGRASTRPSQMVEASSGETLQSQRVSLQARTSRSQNYDENPIQPIRSSMASKMTENTITANQNTDYAEYPSAIQTPSQQQAFNSANQARSRSQSSGYGTSSSSPSTQDYLNIEINNTLSRVDEENVDDLES